MKTVKYISFLIIVLCVGIIFLSSCNKEQQLDVQLPSDSITQTAKNDNTETLAIGARMIYMKYFTLSNSYSVSYDTIPSSMVGKRIDEISGSFEGWEVIYLDSEKMILEKKIDSCGPQTYIISTTMTDGDEFVCVYSFDDMGEKSLYSVFDTPVMLFDEETVNELRSGIMLIGQDALYNALEDFGE